MKLTFKSFLIWTMVFGVVMISTYCTADLESTSYIRVSRNKEIKARIVPDSILIYRSERANGQLNVPITYKAVLLDQEIDSLEWIFPGGNPTSLKEALSAEIIYTDYGSYTSQLVLTQVDTLNLNYIVSYKDTIEVTRPVKIAYEETNWDTFTASNENQWFVLPNSKNVIIRENEVFEQTSPFEARAAFTGFNNQRLKFTVEYKLTHKNYFQNAVSTNTKLEVLIDELKAFGISRVTNDTYFTQEFYIDNLTDFDFIIKKYPALSRSSWELSLSQSGSADSNLALYDLVNQNQLIGYLDLSETNTSSGTLAFLLQTNLNGNDFQFGASDQGQLMALDGTPISLTPGANYKLVFNLEEGLPESYRIIDEKFTTLPVRLEENEYYLDATFRKLLISIE